MYSNKERELERIHRVWEASEEVPVAESCDLNCGERLGSGEQVRLGCWGLSRSEMTKV